MSLYGSMREVERWITSVSGDDCECESIVCCNNLWDGSRVLVLTYNFQYVSHPIGYFKEGVMWRELN